MPKPTKGTVVPNPFQPVMIDTVDREALYGGLISAGHTVEYARVQADTLPSTDGALQMLARHRLQAATAVRGEIQKLRVALVRLEAANDLVAAKTTRERYCTDLSEVQDALLRLDDARSEARAALSTSSKVSTSDHIGAAFLDAPGAFEATEPAAGKVDVAQWAREIIERVDGWGFLNRAEFENALFMGDFVQKVVMAAHDKAMHEAAAIAMNHETFDRDVAISANQARTAVDISAAIYARIASPICPLHAYGEPACGHCGWEPVATSGYAEVLDTGGGQ